MKWFLPIQQYDLKISHRAGIKNTVPDFLSRLKTQNNDEFENTLNVAAYDFKFDRDLVKMVKNIAKLQKDDACY